MNPRPPARWRSLQWRLPLVGGIFLLVVLIGFSATIYMEIRRATADAAAVRLQTVARRLSVDTRGYYSTPLRAARNAVANPDFRTYLDHPDARSEQRAARALQRLASSIPEPFIAEIRTSDGARLLVRDTSGSGTVTFDDPSLAGLLRQDRPLGVGTLSAYGDHLVFPVFVAIPGPGRPGFVVVWRHLLARSGGKQTIADLVGPQGLMLMGDTTQRYWTDLVTTFAAPPARLHVPADSVLPSVVRFERPGLGERFGVAARMPMSEGAQGAASPEFRGAYSPWILLLELPTRVVMAPSDAFFTRLLVIAGAFVLVALVGAWFLSRSLTRPMAELATAADAFNQGDRGRRVGFDRDDELGTVASALNRMLDGTEQTLARKEKLAVLGQLAGGVGHELRNPLGVMNNAVYYLEAVLRDRSSDVTEYLEILRNQINLSDKIVSDLLDFARVRPPQREPVALGELVQRQLARAGSYGDVAVEMIFPPDLPEALGDKVQLGQVVLNLLTNAIQAMDGKGGLLQVRGARVDDNKVALEVRDTGPGIAPENLDRIFEPLFSTKTRGMGLGLAVSRGLAIANGGEIMVRSTAGEGATFTLLLPSAERQGANDGGEGEGSQALYKREAGAR